VRKEDAVRHLSFVQILTILGLGFVGWMGCGAIMFVGMAIASMQATLIAHAIGAPVIFALVSWIYFTKFRYTTPLETAVLFLSLVIFLDLFLVSPLINRSLEMFESFLGTWLPFVLIFLSTYLTGLFIKSRSRRTVAT
jgi:hypothetical protein